MESYPRAAVERAMAKKITWAQAGEIIGLCERQMRRWKERYEEFGYDGLFDRRTGKPSPKRVSVATVEEVLRLYQEQYADFNVRHFHEKLREKHGVRLSYTWVKHALQMAGLVKKSRKRGVHRRRRPRRPLPGMLLHLDGSSHAWFQDDRRYDLLVILDDATSEIYYAQLVEQESTATVMTALRDVIERKGAFCALYSDRASHFFHTAKAGEPVDRRRPTQVGRALAELGIQMIPAYSPQARGRGERSFGTWQGRLITGTTLNVMSLMGVVMMVGIVVSNSILIVEFARHLHCEGKPLKESVSVASRLRLRPILMTSLATILGLIPMALGTEAGSEQYAPLARAIIGGLLVSVVVTVYVVPSAYLLVHRKSEIAEGAQA